MLGGADQDSCGHTDQCCKRKPGRPGLERCHDLLEECRLDEQLGHALRHRRGARQIDRGDQAQARDELQHQEESPDTDHDTERRRQNAPRIVGRGHRSYIGAVIRHDSSYFGMTASGILVLPGSICSRSIRSAILLSWLKSLFSGVWESTIFLANSGLSVVKVG